MGDYAGLQYGSQCICTNTGPQENSEEGKCTYGCAGDQSIKMCGGLGYINIFHTDAHKTTWDDWGCGNSAQDQYYQKWYADMDHCGLTEELPPAPTEAPAGTTTTTTTARTTTTTTIATTTTVTTTVVAEGEQCKQNSECETDLLCDGNLKKCRKRDPGNQGGFCSVGGILCQEAEGDCDKHRECEGSLLCGTFGQFDNKMCQFFDPTHRHTWDCCFSPNATTGFSRENEPCKIDEQCEPGLICDTNRRYGSEPNTWRCGPKTYTYKLVASGTDCNRIQSATECAHAASVLGLRDRNPQVFHVDYRPPACYGGNDGGGRLNSNTDMNGQGDCDYHGRKCVCRVEAD